MGHQAPVWQARLYLAADAASASPKLTNGQILKHQKTNTHASLATKAWGKPPKKLHFILTPICTRMYSRQGQGCGLFCSLHIPSTWSASGTQMEGAHLLSVERTRIY